MKKFLATIVMVWLAVLSASAIPANPAPFVVQQPDGTSLTLRLVGDEFYHFTTTADGYTVVQDADGAYCYAREQADTLASTHVLAHDAASRQAAELQLLQAIPKRVVSKRGIEQAAQRRKARNRALKIGQARRAPLSTYKGLVVLVDYKDVKFSRDDADSLHRNMMNQPGFAGYEVPDSSTDTHGRDFIGSVHDYFSDNSNGQFSTSFDVVGPVQSRYSSTYVKAATNRLTLFSDALTKADDLVDFADYDGDGDGVVDMIYFVVAGHGSNFGGNDSNLLWPHAGELFQYFMMTGDTRPIELDGVVMGRYACSTELYGWQAIPASVMIDGIGTICHEFSHVLGLPDLYDTDYTGSGGTADHPDKWNIMASGSYLCYARVPAGWSSYERLAGGYIAPAELAADSTWTLGSLQGTNQAAVLRSPTSGDFFLLENRQPERWDTYLPGHGMLVWHVDSTDVEAWERNRVNADPAAQGFALLRAGGGTGATDADPFPGTAGVMQLTNATSPSLVNNRGEASAIEITGIAEDGGLVTFTTTAATALEPGDVNGDGITDASDVTALVAVILGESTPTGSADVNGDGTIDATDVSQLIQLLLGA